MKKKIMQGSNLNKLRGLNGNPIHAKISEHDWNFDPARVDKTELVACCLWEYARESNSILKAAETVRTVYANQGIARPESAEREAFRSTADAAFALLTKIGFDISRWTVEQFPKPWQSLEKTEREKLAHVTTPEKGSPFQVSGDLYIASVLHGKATEANKAQQAAWLRLSQMDRDTISRRSQNAAELRKELAAPLPPLIVHGESGVDSFIGQIDWRNFTNKEIKEFLCDWLIKNRPPEIREPSQRGHKPKDWRASLERLGIMRLMNRHSFDELTAIVPCEWLDKEKYNDKTACMSEREKAVKDFHQFFSVLSNETPLSYPPLNPN